MGKKTADLSSMLVAVKGNATVPPDAAGRQIKVEEPVAAVSNAPLNFKVDPEFRRRFRQRAAESDLKLNQLLREALDAWEERQGLKR
ncbi:MAG: hypothetical protein EOM51_10145 [Clostridia bacterium]|nr:hypothetical protein [Clostridia bacterium]